MNSRSLTNVLLAAIAISLLLIVWKLYSPELIATAEAAAGTHSMIMGCYVTPGGVYASNCSFNAVRIDSQGYLLVKQAQ